MAAERRAIAVPVMASNAEPCNDALASAFPDGRSVTTHFGAARIFAVKGDVLTLILPAGATLGGVDWAAFSCDINRYGFSVERVPVALERSEQPVRSPFAVEDAASFVALSTEHRSPMVALDLSRLTHVHSGTNEYALNVGRRLVQTKLDGLTWVVIADDRSKARFGLDEWGVRIFAPDAIDRLFELVFVPHQIYDLAHLKFTGAISLRFAMCMLDVIALRCDYILDGRPFARAVSSTAVQHANLLISLSKAAAKDIRSYYESEGVDVEVEPVLLTKDVPAVHGTRGGRYVLVVGNRYHHKAISIFLQAFLSAKVGVPLVVIADEATAAAFRDNAGLEIVVTGKIPESRMNALYDDAAAVVFPSVYEGFGLPLVGGVLRGKPVFAIDNQVNRELQERFDGAGVLSLFPSHAAIVEHLGAMKLESTAVRQAPSRGPVRSCNDVADETSRAIATACARAVSWSAVFARNRAIRDMVEVSTVRADQDAFLRTLSFRRLGRLALKKVVERLRH
jgi:glycosyltransferase involved in cell wall biosynthesis